MMHLAKLAVGVSDVAHLEELQARRLEREGSLRHQTRNQPRRADEVVDGGSLYWVVAGVMLVRQRIVDIVEDRWDDGTRCAGLLLDPALVRVEGRPMKPFQGWRYLDPADAPADIASGSETFEGLPIALRNELRALCLI